MHPVSWGRPEFPRILALAAVAVSSVLTARAGDPIRSLYEETYGRVDEARLMSRMERLWRCEFRHGHSSQCRAAETAASWLRADGFSDVEVLMMPMDGVSCCQDKRMPEAWEGSVGRLTLLGEKEEVIADYDRHPFHLIKGSSATPPEGVIARIVPEDRFHAGADVKGALIMLNPMTFAGRRNLPTALDRGALGVISEYLVSRDATPDCIEWVNACTETTSWSVDSETRPFVGFSVSPRTGARLRELAAKGEVRARVQCDGRRFVSTLPFVTAVVPGESAKEVWILAHLYEPMADDDSCGVAAAVEIARSFIGGKRPAYTVRVLFGLEHYGYAWYLSRFGTCLRDRVVGALNVDSLAALRGTHMRVLPGGPATPFCGNFIVEAMSRALAGVPHAPESVVYRNGDYQDDMFMGDPTVGVPVIWGEEDFRGQRFWHCSSQDAAHIDGPLFRRGTAFMALLTRLIADPAAAVLPASLAAAEGRLRLYAAEAPGKGRFRHLASLVRSHYADFDRLFGTSVAADGLASLDALAAELEKGVADAAEPDSPARREAAGLTAARATVGFPFDLTRVPRKQRIWLPGRVLYSSYSNVLANMDGRKDLARLIREAEWERNETLDEEDVADYVRATRFLVQWGYLNLKDK